MAEPPAETETDPRGATARADLGSDPTLPSDSAPAEPKLRAGDAIGRFEIRGLLGRGGMGVVYEAFDEELDRRLAIKVIRGGKGSSGDLSERLRREAKAAARLKHPNVIAIYDVGVHNGASYIAMEMVEGETMSSWLQSEPRSWQEIVDAFTAAGRGLQAAHDAGLVHRDFKPENVLVEGDRFCVADFGLAREDADHHHVSGDAPTATPGGVTITQTGAILGTPRYMAPEQRLGKRADARSDQFSFCVALFEALYGEHPFEGERVVPPPPPARAKAPARLHQTLVRGLALEPSRRFGSLGELLHQLNHQKPTKTARRWLIAGTAAILALLVTGFFLRTYVKDANLTAPSAQPDGKPNRMVAVKTSFDMAQDFYQRGQYRAAARGFEHAYAKRGFVQFLYNIGASWEKLHDYCGAAVHYQEYVDKNKGGTDIVTVTHRIDVLVRVCAENPLGATLIARQLMRDDTTQLTAHIADLAAISDGHLLSINQAYDAWTTIDSCADRAHALTRHTSATADAKIKKLTTQVAASCKQKRKAPPWEAHVNKKDFAAAAKAALEAGPPAPLRSLLAALLFDRAKRCKDAATHYKRFARDYPHKGGKKLVHMRIQRLATICGG